MTRYRRFETGTWHDRRFRELSPQPPSAQTLWMHLLCGQRTTIFPGLVVATDAVLASDARWPLDAGLFDGSAGRQPRSFREAWLEIESRGMAVADWEAGVVVLPKALIDRHGRPRESAHPGSPNQFQGWARSWPEVPECQLKDWYLAELGRFALALDSCSAPKREKKESGTGRGTGRRLVNRGESTYQHAYLNGFATSLEPVQDESPTGPPTSRGLTRARARGPDPVTLPEQAERACSDPEIQASDPASDLDLGSPAPEASGSGSTAAARPDRVRLYGATDAAAPPLPPQEPAPHPLPPAETDGPGIYALRQLGDRLWEAMNQRRQALARDLGLRPPRNLHPMLPARTWLAQRLRESGPDGEADVRHVMALREAEVRRHPERFEYFSGSMFHPNAWQRALGTPEGTRPLSAFDAVDEATRAIEAALERGDGDPEASTP